MIVCVLVTEMAPVYWVLAAFLLVLLFVALSAAQIPTPTPTLPSERPARFQPTNDGFEYVRRDEWISMRDGVNSISLMVTSMVREGFFALPGSPAE